VRRHRWVILAGFVVLALLVLVPLSSIWNDTFDVDTSVRTQLDTVFSRLEEYKTIHSHYPETDSEIDSFFSRDGVKRTDRWGTPLRYSLENGNVLLYSFGPNLEDNEGLGDDLLPTDRKIKSER